MATGTKRCKICGKEYEACHTQGFATGAFRWQDVACCPEHGSQYLERVIASRAKPDSDNSDLPDAQADQKKTSSKRSKKR